MTQYTEEKKPTEFYMVTHPTAQRKHWKVPHHAVQINSRC
jgi:hypothetical protein